MAKTTTTRRPSGVKDNVRVTVPVMEDEDEEEARLTSGGYHVRRVCFQQRVSLNCYCLSNVTVCDSGESWSDTRAMWPVTDHCLS